MSRAVDEWGKILQRQSEWHRQRDIAEALKQVEDKHAYRQNLDYQQHLKQMNLERQRMEKQADFHDVVNRARVINDQEAQRRAHEVAVKKLLAQDYQQHLALKKQRELDEKELDRLEKERIQNHIRQQEDEEQQRRAAMRNTKLQHQDDLRWQIEDKDHRRQRDLQEEMYEQRAAKLAEIQYQRMIEEERKKGMALLDELRSKRPY